MNYYQTDLHIHTCLSPCSDLLMSPRAVVKRALKKKLHVIAVCDHNASENVLASVRAAQGHIKVLAGIEVTTVEEVHVLALFEEYRQVEKLQMVVYENLPQGDTEQEIYKNQVIVNEQDEVEGFNQHLLLGATRLTIQDLVDTVHRYDGLAIASHIDRQTFGLIGQLGFIPEGLALDALEITCNYGFSEIRKKHPQTEEYPLITASDAHELDHIGTATTTFYLKKPTLTEIKLAFLKKGRRRILEEPL